VATGAYKRRFDGKTAASPPSIPKTGAAHPDANSDWANSCINARSRGVVAVVIAGVGVVAAVITRPVTVVRVSIAVSAIAPSAAVSVVAVSTVISAAIAAIPPSAPCVTTPTARAFPTSTSAPVGGLGLGCTTRNGRDTK